jgi:dTDP-L-rhamnose 4-epimerase
VPTNVLVIGGAGFIGSHTVDLLLARGYTVRILDALRPPVHPTSEKPAYLPPEAEFCQGDVRNREELLSALHGMDAVIHLAAYQDYLTDFSTFFQINTVGTALLYELIVEHKLPIQKVVVASSQAVYGEAKHHCPNPDCPQTARATGPDGAVRYPDLRPERQLRMRQWTPLCPECSAPLTPVWTDEARVTPHNQYAMSKYTQEMIALNLGRRYGIPSICLRYSIVQGSRQSFTNAYSGVLRIFATRMLLGKAPVAYEDGKQLRDYVYVGDVAAANLLVLQDPRADFRCFNVGGGHATTVLHFGEMVARAVGTPIRPELPGQYRFGDTRHVFSETAALRSLGWRTTKTPQEVVDEYVAWVANHPDLADSYGQAEQVMLRTGTVRRALSVAR